MSTGTINLEASYKPPQHWTADLRLNKNLEFLGDVSNVMHALRLSPEWRGLLSWDEAWKQVVVQRDPPYAARERPPRWWTEEDETLLHAWLLEIGFAAIGQRTVQRAVECIAKEQPFHPVQKYLCSLTWDRVPRIDNFLCDYLGVKDAPYARAVGRRFLISAVARAMTPGSKVDTVLILEGKQGLKKSTFLETLAGRDFFSNNLAAFGTRDSHDQVHGVWMHEIQEIDRAIKGAGASRTKSFLTIATDYYRPAYSRKKVKMPRDSVFIGTTNRQQYLVDSSGNRRFWPVFCTKSDIDALAANRDQIWAEAVARFRAGEQWHLTDAEEKLALIQQRARVEQHPFAELVVPYLHRVPKGGSTSLKEIFAGPLRKRDRTPGRDREVVKILQSEGWILTRPRKNNASRERKYRRADD